MFHLFLVTPEKTVLDGDVLSIIVPGTYGTFEVLKDHAPIISSLTAGKLIITDTNKQKTLWAVSGGVIEVSNNKATILADAVELASEIDLKRAEKDLKKAQKLIEEDGGEVDEVRAEKALKRAKNRIKIAQEYQNTRHQV